MTNVVHIIAGLGVGGAERIMVDLIQHQLGQDKELTVVNFLNEEDHAQKLKKLGVNVISLGYRWRGGRAVGAIRAAFYLFWLFRRAKPDIAHTWLYSADVIGGTICKLFGVRVIWGIFTGNVQSQYLTWNARFFFWLCCRLSNIIPNAIVSVSAAGRRSHIAAGYDPRKIVFIPTGFRVLEKASRDKDYSKGWEKIDRPIFGMLGRISKEKDHNLLIEAVGCLKKDGIEVALELAGGVGVDARNSVLTIALNQAGISSSTLIRGRVIEVVRFLNGLDVFCLISNSEGFPTVIGEAMAGARTCIVSDVGDARILVNDDRQLVPRGDLNGLVDSLRWAYQIGQSGRAQVGLRNRSRIAKHFRKEKMMSRYDQVYDSAMSDRS